MIDSSPSEIEAMIPRLTAKFSRGIAVVIVLTAALAGCSTTRHWASAVAHDPSGLPGSADASVHFEYGAQECARAVSALLDQAISDVDTAHGRPFVSQPLIAAYSSDDAYAAANGAGSPFPAAVTFRARIALSPRLCGPEKARLKGVLTHELSHAHLAQHLSAIAYIGLPVWFQEGLAVSISDGGGAERVSPEEGRAAIVAGRRIAIVDQGSLFNLVGIRFENPNDQVASTPAENAMMAYRQAGMFVDDLRRDRAAFADLMDSLLRGERFAGAFERAYHATPREAWSNYVMRLTRLTLTDVEARVRWIGRMVAYLQRGGRFEWQLI